MTAKVLKERMERVETWLEEAQAALAEIALEIDAGLSGGVYHPTCSGRRKAVGTEKESAVIGKDQDFSTLKI